MILKKAGTHFQKKEYNQAYSLYLEAAKRYGRELVAYNLQVCEKHINKVVLQDKFTDIENVENNLDCVTKLLLDNSKDKIITGKERNSCLEVYNKYKTKKSKELEVKQVNPIPADWPKELKLFPLPESTNDFKWLSNKKTTERKSYHRHEIGLSIIVPTFNRSNILDITLACLVNQETSYNFEVIVADDGSKENLEVITRKYENILDIKLVRQRDYGYQLCAVRNLGLRTAKYYFVSILDCDMAPNKFWVESYLKLLIENDNIALIGPRKYVNTHYINSDEILSNKDLISSLPEVITNNKVAGKEKGTVSVDWRLEHFKKTENLRLDDTPFRYFSGGNVAFARKWLDIAGWFDEEFTHWGGEDNEFGYRLYRAGCFFRAVDGGMAYHQEPPGKENETDRAAGQEITRKIIEEKVPYFYRKLLPIENAVIKKVPLVSIYVPAYNCQNSIVKCVESALNQTITDLEVCICNDGSTDNTLEILEKHYGNHPRVRFMTQTNGGIGKASNTAVKMCKGYYIGQLDSDDYLEPDAVEVCLKEFMADRSLACVYTTNRNVNPDGSLIANGYNWPVYSREKLTTAMICHHFRMFTARAWNLTTGFDEKITNAVDYDMYLKLSEVGPFKHINKICYNRVLHGENTSIKKLSIQKENHFKVVNESLKRQSIEKIEYKALSDKDTCRKYIFLEKL